MGSIEIFLNAISSAGWCYELKYDGGLHKMCIWKSHWLTLEKTWPHWEKEDVTDVVMLAFHHACG